MSAYTSRVGNILDPGAPRKIVHQGHRLLTSQREGSRGAIFDKVRTDSPKQDHDGQASAWGIERCYAELLERLAAATVGKDRHPL